MKIFIICPVRNATDEHRQKLASHVRNMEAQGHEVYYPALDTDQSQDGLTICSQNRSGIESADLVDVFFVSSSMGSYFDLGQAFALGKKIRVIRNEPLTVGKSFQNMIQQWQELG